VENEDSQFLKLGKVFLKRQGMKLNLLNSSKYLNHSRKTCNTHCEYCEPQCFDPLKVNLVQSIIYIHYKHFRPSFIYCHLIQSGTSNIQWGLSWP
jgi:hypothetical protein